MRDKRARTAIRRNETVFLRLTRSFNDLGKRVAGVGAAAALETVMTKGTGTIHDSSRAAANWDININNINPYRRPTDALSPKYYKDDPNSTDTTKYAIGNRGDGGKNAGAMMGRKRQRYGYTQAGGGADVKVKEGSWIFNQLQLGKPGMPAIHLFNPIAGRIPQYAINAFPGFEALYDSIQDRVVNSANLAAFEQIKKINYELRQRGKVQ